MTEHHLAQLNVGTLQAPLDSPDMADFVALLDPINALADSSPGFVWRLRDEDGPDATTMRPFGGDLLVNMSVWESFDALWNFAYRSRHLDVLRRRREWFTKTIEVYQVLWWVPAGSIPSVHEAGERLAYLRENGPSSTAFTFKDPFPSPGSAARM